MSAARTKVNQGKGSRCGAGRCFLFSKGNDFPSSNRLGTGTAFHLIQRLLGLPSCSAGYRKLDPERRPPTLLAGFVGYVDEFLGNLPKEKAQAGLESGTVVSVNG
jgi:hypothetical protein